MGAIEKYLTGGYNVEAIKYQVTNGKGSMPAFGERLGPDDIEDVANYVFNQADKWPRDALPRLTSRTRGQRRPRGGEERFALGPVILKRPTFLRGACCAPVLQRGAFERAQVVQKMCSLLLVAELAWILVR